MKICQKYKLVSIILLSVLFIVLVGAMYAKKVNLEGEENVDIKISNIKKTDKVFSFTYVVRNNSPNDIWICDNIAVKSAIRVEINIDVKRKSVIIRLASFMVPAHISLEEPIWAKYIRLGPGDSYKSKIKIELPVTEQAPIDLVKPGIKTNFNSKDIIFELGIYKRDLYKDETVRRWNSSTKDIVYLSCFWARENKELILRKKIENFELPCQANIPNHSFK